jgi:hypothetical protein
MRGGVRPVDCFYEGENMLVIHPDECIGISAMPALSQKQTFSDVRFLSNDVRSASESCAVQLGVSAMGQKRTSDTRSLARWIEGHLQGATADHSCCVNDDMVCLARWRRAHDSARSSNQST